MSKPGQRWTASRKTPSSRFPDLANHNRRVGEVVHAYNNAQASFFILFYRLVGEDYQLASKLWHTQPSDSAQRSLLDPFVQSRIRRKLVRNGLIWALKAMNELSTFRNDAVHSEMLWYYEKLVPGLSTKPERRKRLLELPFEQIWRKLRGDLWAIAVYVSDLDQDVQLDNPRPSTERPRLLLARSMSADTQAKRSRAKKAARDHQRQPSNK
jgi:hypothetical protein